MLSNNNKGFYIAQDKYTCSNYFTFGMNLIHNLSCSTSVNKMGNLMGSYYLISFPNDVDLACSGLFDQKPVRCGINDIRY